MSRGGHFITIDFRQQGIAFFLKAAQHRVHQSGGPGFLQMAAGRHRPVYRGEVGNTGVDQLIQADPQQGKNVTVPLAQRFTQQSPRNGLQARPPT